MLREIIKVNTIKIGQENLIYQLESSSSVDLGIFEQKEFQKRGVIYRNKYGEIHVGLNGELIKMSPTFRVMIYN
jgi:hypothetical protein